MLETVEDAKPEILRFFCDKPTNILYIIGGKGDTELACMISTKFCI
jgi:hypothetical protein